MQRFFGQKLDGFTLKHENGDFGAMITALESPEIKRRTQDVSPGGLIGALKTVHGFESMSLKISYEGIEERLFRMLRAGKINQQRFQIFAAFADEYSGEILTMVQTLQGRVVSSTPLGEFKADENVKGELELALTYWKLEYGGEEKICLDFLNNIARFDGVDEYADQRRALGYA